MTFTKKLNWVKPNYSFDNEVIYDIVEESSSNSTLKVTSTFTGELNTGKKIYHIKPITKFFTIKSFKILLDSKQIGKIEFWGWIWKKPKLIIKAQGYEQVWVFERIEPKLFKNRANSYITKLKHQNRELVYKIEIDNSSIGNENLKNLKGEANFIEDDKLQCLLGIYLNELLIFDEMNK